MLKLIEVSDVVLAYLLLTLKVKHCQKIIPGVLRGAGDWGMSKKSIDSMIFQECDIINWNFFLTSAGKIQQAFRVKTLRSLQKLLNNFLVLAFEFRYFWKWRNIRKKVRWNWGFSAHFGLRFQENSIYTLHLCFSYDITKWCKV